MEGGKNKHDDWKKLQTETGRKKNNKRRFSTRSMSNRLLNHLDPVPVGERLPARLFHLLIHSPYSIQTEAKRFRLLPSNVLTICTPTGFHPRLLTAPPTYKNQFALPSLGESLGERTGAEESQERRLSLPGNKRHTTHAFCCCCVCGRGSACRASFLALHCPVAFADAYGLTPRQKIPSRLLGRSKEKEKKKRKERKKRTTTGLQREKNIQRPPPTSLSVVQLSLSNLQAGCLSLSPLAQSPRRIGTDVLVLQPTLTGCAPVRLRPPSPVLFAQLPLPPSHSIPLFFLFPLPPSLLFPSPLPLAPSPPRPHRPSPGKSPPPLPPRTFSHTRLAPSRLPPSIFVHASAERAPPRLLPAQPSPYYRHPQRSWVQGLLACLLPRKVTLRIATAPHRSVDSFDVGRCRHLPSSSNRPPCLSRGVASRPRQISRRASSSALDRLWGVNHHRHRPRRSRITSRHVTSRPRSLGSRRRRHLSILRPPDLARRQGVTTPPPRLGPHAPAPTRHHVESTAGIEPSRRPHLPPGQPPTQLPAAAPQSDE